MIQGTNSNPLMSMLMAQSSTDDSHKLVLSPQVEGFAESEQLESPAVSSFSHMLFMLQTGEHNSITNSSMLKQAQRQLSGNSLPDDGQNSPLFDSDLSIDETLSSQSFALSDTLINEDNQSIELAEDTTSITPDTVAQAIDMAKNLDAVTHSSKLNMNKSESIEVESSAAIEQVTTEQSTTEKNTTEKNTTAQIIGVDDTVEVQANDLSTSPLPAELDAHQDEALNTDPSLMPASALSAQVNTLKNTESSNSASIKNKSTGVQSSFGLRSKGDGELIQDGGLLNEAELDTQMQLSEQDSLGDDKSAAGKETLQETKENLDLSLSARNQGQTAVQSAQALNSQTAQATANVVDSVATTVHDKFSQEQLEQTSDKTKLSVHEQINKTIEKQETLYLSRQTQQWGQQLGTHIRTLIKQDIQEAKIHLDPPELGSLEIKLQVQNQETKIQIHASQPQVRDVLEQQAFRLREALAQEGMSLSGFDVSSGDREQTQQNGQEQGSSFNGGALSEMDGSSQQSEVQNRTAVSGLNLIDTFA